ncbi:hypothetical protein HPB50_004658 [Hyalomma asiaticum]|uniref:Uncharacterized protein n=1 Tax=Hyalomma asiaticum TaxID=266040 RepID=A0ACB7T8C8_HYAAI|nr:hypothetical protein HPB50_004658 [Hyalomma asiaticum]
MVGSRSKSTFTIAENEWSPSVTSRKGGLRSVVWADCVQALVMFAAPLSIIGKVLHDARGANPPLRPMRDFNVRDYAFRTEFDVSSDENIWACVAASLPYTLVRVGFDQMSVQRFMAARTVQAAKRTAIAGGLLVLVFFAIAMVAAVTLIYWYRDCDPALHGAIKTYDQLFLSLYSSASGPFAGLVLLAVSSPWVNAKGAGWGSVLVCIVQLWHALGRSMWGSGVPPFLPRSLDRCPSINNTATMPATMDSAPPNSPQCVHDTFVMSGCRHFVMEYGGVDDVAKNIGLTSPSFLKLWNRFRFLRRILKNAESPKEEEEAMSPLKSHESTPTAVAQTTMAEKNSGLNTQQAKA